MPEKKELGNGIETFYFPQQFVAARTASVWGLFAGRGFGMK
jgi:hypothetical protein